MKKLTGLDKTALILTIVGGLNWGFVALGPKSDVLASLFGGPDSLLVHIVYGLIGVSAVYLIFTMGKFIRK